MIVVSGGLTSTGHEPDWGVGATFPAGSLALAWNGEEPSVRPLSAAGEVQAGHPWACDGPSSRHSKPVWPPLPSKVNVAAPPLMLAPVRPVSGGVESMVQARASGNWSTH